MGERVVLSAIEKAAGSSLDFRAGMPVNFLRFMGTWHDSGSGAGKVTNDRAAFTRRFKSLLRSLEEFADLDEVCDELGVDFSAQRLPPPPPPSSADNSSASTAG